MEMRPAIVSKVKFQGFRGTLRMTMKVTRRADQGRLAGGLQADVTTGRTGQWAGLWSTLRGRVGDRQASMPGHAPRKRWPLLSAVGAPHDNYGRLVRAMRQDRRIDGPERAGRWRGDQSDC